jgi:hypothetical protein
MGRENLTERTQHARRRGAVVRGSLLALAAAAALGTISSTAAQADALPTTDPCGYTIDQQWQAFASVDVSDQNEYVAFPNGTLAAATSGVADGWSQNMLANVVQDSDVALPYDQLGYPSADQNVMDLLALGAATSPAVCASQYTPSARVMIKNVDTFGKLTITEIVSDSGGVIGKTVVATLTESNTRWDAGSSSMIAIPSVPVTWTADPTVSVKLKFSTKGGEWEIDDLYLDPFKNN